MSKKQSFGKRLREIFARMNPKYNSHARRMLNQSMKCEEEGDINKALEVLSQISYRSKYYVRSIEDRANILNENGRETEVLSCYENINPLCSNYSVLVVQKACALANAKQCEQAIKLLTEEISDNDREEYIESLRFIGRFYKEMSNQQKYEEYYQLANSEGLRLLKEKRINNVVFMEPE